MRSVKRNTKSLGFGTALVLAFAVLMGAVGRADAPNFWIHEDADGERWVVGCVPQDIADRMVSENGFQAGPGPSFVLCIDGTTAVHKKMGR